MPSRRARNGRKAPQRSRTRAPLRPTWRIRRATEDDIPGVLECLRAAFDPYRDQYTPIAFRATVLTPQSARQRVGSMVVFVAVDARGTVLGTVSARRGARGRGNLRGMAVRPSHQGTGLAPSLLDRALRHLARENCESVTLGTTAPLRRALRFYERNGFARTRRTLDFFGMPLAIYSRHLGPPRRPAAPTGSGRTPRTKA